MRITMAMVAVLLLATVASAQTVPLTQLIREPVKYDQRPLTVSGTVSTVENTSRPGGPPLQVFLLLDEGISVRVTAPAAPAVRMGDRVEVEGIFRMFGNQIEAFRVTFR